MVLFKGETIIAIGHSPKKGHLVVEKYNHTLHVPYRYLELKQII
jgi:dachs protein